MLLASFAALSATAAVPCAPCHPREAASYAGTRMASALLPVRDSAFAKAIDRVALHEAGNGFQYVYTKTADGLLVSASRDGDVAAGEIQWVLGSGAQGQTPIVKAGVQFFESRVSFFPRLGQYGITVGQSAAASSHALASLGRPKSEAELTQCFGCHAKVLDTGTQSVVPGVQCETCHPGAAQHAAGHGQPLNPGKLAAGEQVRFCGNCHRNSPPLGDGELENVRFQPLRLMKSDCFASGKLSCGTCHAAHQDARRADATFYNGKCLECHAGRVFHTDARATGDCIGCHMPQIQIHPALRFTDHYIRSVKPSDYPQGVVVERAAR